MTDNMQRARELLAAECRVSPEVIAENESSDDVSMRIALRAIAAAMRLAVPDSTPCTWRKQDEYGDHVSTGCGHEFILNDAGDYEDGKPAFPFCCYCAKPTVFRQWKDESECHCDNSDGPECWACSDRRSRQLAAAPRHEPGEVES